MPIKFEFPLIFEDNADRIMLTLVWCIEYNFILKLLKSSEYGVAKCALAFKVYVKELQAVTKT